jgi:LPS-assembly lipoprotein
MGAVRATDPTDKNSFDFVQHLEERLGRPTKPAYALAYTITTTAIGAGITPDGAITRYNVKGGLDWTLTRLSDQKRMVGGHIDAFTSYSATGSTVAGQTAQSDAYLRLMRLLGDDLVMRLVAASTQFAP